MNPDNISCSGFFDYLITKDLIDLFICFPMLIVEFGILCKIMKKGPYRSVGKTGIEIIYIGLCKK